ncbi:unnamed protein product [Lactuca saligna]|uniref:rRNA N-glycosidase n=1 Tax=Lactuca saligna TaxID=75948 RepID=A0AA35ZRP0_LACSI|nr:unnamed protein product [Lactuca saligna]
MSFLWIALLHLMVAVMGHESDGGDEPPHPFGGGFDDHQNDVVPPRRRDMVVNKQMHKLFKVNGEWPLKIVFDINTNMSIGEVYECFIRDVGSYMWWDIAFDKDTWTNVFEAERTWFDFGAITNHPMAPTYWASLNNRIWDVEALRAQAHTGEFVDPLVEDQYNVLVAEVALQTHHIADSGGDLDTIDWIAIFEKVLGTRKGRVRGIGPKASSAAGTSAPSQWQSQAPQPTQDVDVNAFLQNPTFVTVIGDIIRSFKNKVNNEEKMMGKTKTKKHSISCFMLRMMLFWIY